MTKPIDPDDDHKPEELLRKALSYMTSVLFSLDDDHGHDERAKVQLAHDKVQTAWRILADQGKLPPDDGARELT